MLRFIHMVAAIFMYECPRCHYVEQYSIPKPGCRCPKCGFAMFPKHN